MQYEQTNQVNPAARRQLLMYGVALVLLIATLIWSRSGATPAAAPTTRQWQPVNKGQTGQLYHDDGSQIWLTDTTEGYDALAAVLARGRKDDVLTLQRVGEATIVPSQTRVRVLNQTFTLHQVRVIEGPQKGLTGWVAAEEVYPAQ